MRKEKQTDRDKHRHDMFFLQKQMLCGVFCKSKTENSEKNKTNYTR